MDAAQPRVVSVRNYRGGKTGIAFEDGHELMLTGYSDNGSFGDCSEDVERIVLSKDGYRVVEYNSRKYHAGPRPNEHAVAAIADGFTPQTLGRYLEAAKTQVKLDDDHIDGDDRWFAWKLLGHTDTDVAVLQSGRSALSNEAPAPERLPSAAEVVAKRAAEEAQHQRRREFRDQQDVTFVVRALSDVADQRSLEEKTRNQLTSERLAKALTTLEENGQVEIEDGTPCLTEQAMRQRMTIDGRFGDTYFSL